jgi:hypothetical protein
MSPNLYDFFVKKTNFQTSKFLLFFNAKGHQKGKNGKLNFLRLTSFSNKKATFYKNCAKALNLQNSILCLVLKNNTAIRTCKSGNKNFCI